MVGMALPLSLTFCSSSFISESCVATVTNDRREGDDDGDEPCFAPADFLVGEDNVDDGGAGVVVVAVVPWRKMGLLVTESSLRRWLWTVGVTWTVSASRRMIRRDAGTLVRFGFSMIDDEMVATDVD